MNGKWPLVRLGDVVKQISRTERVEPAKEYRLLGVRLNGRGPFIRECILGSNTSATTLNQVQEGDFVYSRLFAWRGSFGIISRELDGCYVSNEFPLFSIIAERLDIRFLWFWLRLPQVLATVEADCTGSTPLTRNRYKERFFCSLEIPLPPLDEQRRIVARIEEIAGRIEEAQKVHNASQFASKTVFDSVLSKIWQSTDSWTRHKIGDIAQTVSGQVDPTIEPYASLPHINGEAMESGTCRLKDYKTANEYGVTSGKYHFIAGSVLYSKIRPYLRKAVQVPVEGICSADVYAFAHIHCELEPRFFMYTLIAPPFTSYANSISGRTLMPKLNKQQLFDFELCYPDIHTQRAIVEHLDSLQLSISKLKHNQDVTSKSIDALLPTILDKAFRGKL